MSATDKCQPQKRGGCGDRDCTHRSQVQCDEQTVRGRRVSVRPYSAVHGIRSRHRHGLPPRRRACCRRRVETPPRGPPHERKRRKTGRRLLACAAAAVLLRWRRRGSDDLKSEPRKLQRATAWRFGPSTSRLTPHHPPNPPTHNELSPSRTSLASRSASSAPKTNNLFVWRTSVAHT